MSALDFIARLAGVPQDTIDEIEKAAPTAAKLLKLVNDNQQLIKDAEALLTRALPLINEATNEIMLLLPAATDILKFVNQPKDPTHYPGYPDPNQS